MKPSLLKLAVLMAGIFAAGAGHAQSYQFVDLGSGAATGINNLGQVVGYSNLGATLWSGGGRILLAGGINATPYAIGNSGQIVGSYSTFGSGNPSAIKWTASGTAKLPSDFGFGAAYAINNAGQIVGTGGGEPATLWTGTGYTNLTLANDTWSGTATGINNAGLIAGYAQENGGGMQAVSWTTAGGNATLLNTLGGSYSQAMAVNNAGEMVGQSTNAAGTLYATAWRGSTPTELQSLGGQFSYATGINDAGTVVGSSTTASGQVVATLWNGVRVVNLNSYLTPAELQAGWVLTEATGINQNGWIVGDAVNTKIGGSDAFELRVPSPVPEADIWGMMLAGLGLIGVCRYRKRAASAVS